MMPIAWLTLPLLWTISNGIFAVLLLGTWFATSVAGASFIIAAAGFCWAITNWAPFAIVSLRSHSAPPTRRALTLIDKLGDLILRMGVSSPSHVLQDAQWDNVENASLSPIMEEGSDYEPSVAGKTNTPRQGRVHGQDEEGRFPDPRPEGRRREEREGEGEGEASLVGTPPSATSAYFDTTSMGTPERGTFPTSPSPPGARTRESSHPYDYPPMQEHYSSSLSLGDHDPYAYPGGGSTSTILAHHADRTTPTVLQIRHSDDTYERESSEEGSERASDEEEEEKGARRGSASSAIGRGGGNEPPRITMGEEGDDWEIGGEGDEGDGAGDQAGVILGWVRHALSSSSSFFFLSLSLLRCRS